MVRTIRDNVPAAGGVDYSIELTDSEKLEFFQNALTLAVEEMEKTIGKHCIKEDIYKFRYAFSF